MTVCFLAPIINDYPFFIPGGNTPANGAQLQTFIDGSSTPVTVYKDSAAAVAWSNPILLDSGGSLPLGGEIWIPTGIVIKAILAPANDTFPAGSPYYTWPGLSGMNDVSSQTGVAWISGPTPTFISATSFSLAGDQRTNFTLGRRIQTTNTGGTRYSTITAVNFGAGITTVTVVNDSGSLDAGLSAVFYSLFDPSNSPINFYYVGKDGGTTSTNVAGTTDIWGIPGTQVHINNTNAIFSFSSAAYAGGQRVVIADSSFPLNTSATLSIPGNQNVTTQAGDRFTVIASTASVSVITQYTSNQTPLYQFQTSGQVFAGPSSGTSAAAPSFRQLAGAESAMSLLSTKNVTSAVSTVSFTTSDINWTAYDEYEFHLIQLIPTNNAATFGSQISENGGTSYISTASYSEVFNLTSSAVIVAGTGTGQTNWRISGQQANSVDFPLGGKFVMYKPSNSVQKKIQSSEKIIYIDSNGPALSFKNVAHEYTADANAFNGIQFFYSAGNVSSGTIRAYGIKTS